MAILFLDTTYRTTLGLLDNDLKWLHFKVFEDQKASSFLQNEVHLMCSQNGIKLKSLDSVITLAGPGFYTGLRVSEGFSDIFDFFGIPKCSFYSFDIPKILGFKEGMWITKAYRGEYFVHSWGDQGEKSELFKIEDFNLNFIKESHSFIHSKQAFDLEINAQNTLDLIKTNPSIIFKKVLDLKLKKEVFYFRAPEDEFRMNP